MDIVGCGGASFISRLRRGGGRGAGFRARDRDLFRSFRAACIPGPQPPGLLPLPSEEEISSQNTEASSSASTQAPPESHEPPASSSPASSAPPQGKINLNTAGKEELMSIKGLGEILAERILDYRESARRLRFPGGADGGGWVWGEALCRLETLSDAVAGDGG